MVFDMCVNGVHCKIIQFTGPMKMLMYFICSDSQFLIHCIFKESLSNEKHVYPCFEFFQINDSFVGWEISSTSQAEQLSRSSWKWNIFHHKAFEFNVLIYI